MNRSLPRGFLGACLAAALFSGHVPPAAGADPPAAVTGEIGPGSRWKGNILLEGKVTLPQGGSLVIEPGTNVRFGKGASLTVSGRLLAEGDARQPIVFEPDPATAAGEPWSGMTVVDATQARFVFCRWRGAREALVVVNAPIEIESGVIEDCARALQATTHARVTITGSRFTGNQAGVSIALKSSLTVTDSVFEGNGEYGLKLMISVVGVKISGNLFKGEKIGLILEQVNDAFLSGNTFSNCELGLVLNQVKQDVRLSGNTFDGGNTGILVTQLATPWIACCRFNALEKAVLVDRYSSPMLTNDLFEKNRDAVVGLQKSELHIRRNIFRNNTRAIFLDFSSYPAIHENNFSDNERDVALGDNMSADYEKRVGSGNTTLSNAQQSGSHNLGLLGQAQGSQYTDTVEARHNWWGEGTTREMEKAGPEANLKGIEDFHDTPLMSYPGWSEGTYRKDRVIYEPWEKSEVAGAGPLPGGCGDYQPPAESDKP